MNLTDNQSNAVGQVVELKKYGSNLQIHPGTAITAAARLAGSFLFRSLKIEFENAVPIGRGFRPASFIKNK